MKRLRNITYALLALLAAVSCSTEMMELETPGLPITGLVTDTDGNPIEHIKITMEWTEAGISESFYTSSEGTFFCESHLSEDGDTEILVTLEDIDGEENGGLFEKSVKVITLMKDELDKKADSEEKFRIEMTFLLTHATPSENIPQS